MTPGNRLPCSTDVAIIGGGIIGIASALALVNRGMSVSVFEKGTLACEQSSRNWGWIRTLMRHPSEVPLALQAGSLWRDIQRQVDVGFRQSGILYLAKSAKDMHSFHTWQQKTASTDAVLLSKKACSEMIPDTTTEWFGGLYSQTDAVAEPKLATQGLASLVRQRHGQIFENCAVRGLNIKSGRLEGIETEYGTVKAKNVLLAGGAWSRLFCLNTGIALPQLKVHASVLRVSAPDANLPLTINGKDFTCRQDIAGDYVVSQFNSSYADLVPDSFRLCKHYLPAWLSNNGLVKLRLSKRFWEELRIPNQFNIHAPTPFEKHRILDPRPLPQTAHALQKLALAFPCFSTARIKEMWSGYIDVTPDALPFLDEAPSIPGLFIATGFSGHGFGISPAVGEAIGSVIAGSTPALDLHPFRLSRF